MNNENGVPATVDGNNGTPETKPTLRERIKNIPVKKVLKIAGIVAGSVVGTIVLGKLIGDQEPDWEEYEDADYNEVPSDDPET